MSRNYRRSPYQGLIPYEEVDAPFFFGREKEIRLITANLFAAPLTLLYGASGAGKTSVLRAGVVPRLRQRQDLLVVVYNTWQGDSITGLKAALAEAGKTFAGKSLIRFFSAPFSEYLQRSARELNLRLMFVLAQLLRNQRANRSF